MTRGTGPRIGELLGLASGQLFERAPCQSARDGGADLFHLVEVHIEVGAVFPVGTVGDDFAPLLGQFLQRRQLFR